MPSKRKLFETASSPLRSAMPDEALQVIRYTIDPQIDIADKISVKTERTFYGFYWKLPND